MTIHDRGNRAIRGVHIYGIRFDRHRLREVAHLESEVLLQIVEDIEGDSSQMHCFESALLHFHEVMTGTHTGEGVKAAVSTYHCPSKSPIHVGQTNGGI